MSSASVLADPVISGIGALTPVGVNAAETWRGLAAGRSGVGPVTRFDASDLPVRIAGEVKGFDPEALLGTKRMRRSARVSQLAVPPRARRPRMPGWT